MLKLKNNSTFILLFLLSVGVGLFYENQRVLKYFPDSQMKFQFQLDHSLRHPKVFIEFEHQPLDLSRQSILVSQPHQSDLLFFTSDSLSRDWKNHLLGRPQKLEAGTYLAKAQQGQLKIKEFRLEYRQSSFEFLRMAVQKNDFRFKLVALGLGALIACLFLALLWPPWISGFLVFGVSLGLVWLLSPPMSGFDDITHLPGFIYRLSGTDVPTAYLETAKLIKEANYMELNDVPREVIQDLRSKRSFCPQQLSDPSFSLENCNIYVSLLVDHLVWFHRLYIDGSDARQIEIFGKSLNQLFILIFCFALSLYVALAMSRSLKITFAASLLALLVPYYFLPHTMGVGTDFLLFSATGLATVAYFHALSLTSNVKSIFLLMITGGLSFFLMRLFPHEDYKRILILFPFFVATVVFLLTSVKDLKVYSRSGWITMTIVLASILIAGSILFDSLKEWLRVLPKPVSQISIVIENLTNVSYPNLFYEVVRALSGPLITNKATLIPAMMWGQTLALFMFGFFSLRSLWSKTKSRAYLFLFLLVVSIPISLLLVGLALNDLKWVFPRYTYPMWGAFFITLNIWASSDEKRFKALLFSAASIQFLAATTMLIPNYWMKLGIYP